MLTLLLATRNRKKAREIRRLLRGARVRFLSVDQFPEISSVKEDGATFKANALKKAVQTSRRTILPVLAEDSGLEVRALGGRPGVRSARFALRRGSGQAGSGQDDRANVVKLLKVMKKVPASRRQARFVCWMALSIGGRPVATFQAACSGSIAFHPSGRTGFGYDPLFIPRGFNQTLAELGPRIKDSLSHRAKAARRFKGWLLKRGL